MPQNDYFKKAYNIASEGGLEVSPGVFFNNLHNAKYFDKFYTIATEGGLTISKEEFKNRLGIGNEVKYMYEKDGTKVTPEQYFNKRQAPTQPQQTTQAPQFKDPMDYALESFRSSQVKPKFNPIQQPTPQTQTQTEKGAFRLPTEQELQTFTKTVPDKSSKVLPQGDIIEPVTLANVRSKIDEQLSKGVKDPLANITQYQKEQANNNIQDKYNLEQEGFSKQIQDIDTYSSILEQQLNNQAMGWDNNGGDFMTMFLSSQENLNKNIQTFTAFQTEKQKELEAVNNKFQQASDQYQNGTIDQYQYNAALEEAKASQKNILQEVETKKQQVQAIANEHNKKYSSADIQQLQGLYQLKNDLLVKRYQAIDNPEYADLKAKYSKWDVEQSKADESDKIRQKYLNGELSQEEIKKYTEDGTLQNRNAQAWFARTVGKLTSDILTLPRTFTPNDSYGWTDRLADWANRLNQDITMSNPYSSNLQQSTFQKIAVDPTGQYKVILDDDGEIKSVKLKDGYNAPSFVQEQIKKQYEADKSKFSTPQTEFNEDVLMKNAVNTMTDMGILILGSKGASLALKLGSLGQKMTTGAAIFGQVHNDIYNGAIEQGLSPSEASQLAILTGSGLAMVSYVNPLEYNLASNATRNMVTQADVALINSGKLSVSELSKQYVKGIAKNIVGENLEEVVLEPILTDVLAGSYGMESNEFDPISKEGLETLLITSLVSLPMGVAEVNQELPDYKIQSYKLGAENLIVYNNIMQDKLNKGIITQEEFDTQTEQFAKFAQRYNYTKGQVKENQRDKLVELLVDKSTLENNISTIGDKSLTINEQERLKEVDNELAQLLQQPKVKEQPISEQKEKQPIEQPTNEVVSNEQVEQPPITEEVPVEEQPIVEPIQQPTPRPKKEEFARKLRERLEREKAKDVKVESAVIEIGGKIYEGKNHAEAILKAKEDGQDISNVNRQEQGKFKLSDGTIIDRSEAKQRFGQDRSELMIEQDKASEQANKDYKKITEASDKVETDIVGKKFQYNNAEWEVLEDRGDKVMVSNGSAKIIVKKDDVLANINPVEKVEQPTVLGKEEGSGGGGDVKLIENSEKWYKAEKKIIDKDGNEITLTIDKNKEDKHFYIKAKDVNGKEIGSALFETSNGKVWSGNEIEVNESNRRKGVMSAMYDFAESEGHSLEPTKTLSKEGKAFWDNRKQSLPTQEGVEQPISKKETTENPALASVEATAKALEGKTSGLIQEPTVEQKVDDTKNKRFATFTYNKKSEVPDALKDKISSTKTVNGKTTITVTLPLSEADYLLNRDNPQAIAEAYHKAKVDGSNPELVKAVEGLLGKQEKQGTQSEVASPVSGEGKVDKALSSVEGTAKQELDADKLNKEAGVDIYVARQEVESGGNKYYLSQIKENNSTNTFLIEDANGNEIGKAQLSKDGNFLENIRIDEKHRRKGLASKVYDFIELRKGIELEPSPNKQSKEAKALWDKRNLQKSVSNKANGGLLAKALGESMSKAFSDFRKKQEVLLELENRYFKQKGLSREDFNKLSESDKADVIKDAVKWKNENPELVKAVEELLGQKEVKPQEVKAEQPTVSDNPALASVEATAKALEGVDNDKIVEAFGKKVIHHGTGIDFSVLDENKQNSATGHGDFGKGFYFSIDKGIARYYSLKFDKAVRRVKSFLHSIARPFEINITNEIFDSNTQSALKKLKGLQYYEKEIILNNLDKEFGYKKITKEIGDSRFSDILETNGFDAVWVNRTLGGETKIGAEIVVFNKKNVTELTNKSISEAYHKSKADGSNPELVKAVEELLGKEVGSGGYVESVDAINRKREEYGLEPLKPTYRGTSKAEWDSVQNGEPFKSKTGFGDNESNTTWVSDKKEYSDEYFKSNEDGVLVEFKPEAIDKSVVESGQQGDDTGVRLGRNLKLEDVQRVTDKNGNVIYEAPTQEEGLSPKIEKVESYSYDKLPNESKDDTSQLTENWRNTFEELKAKKDNEGIQILYNKLKVLQNGVIQGKAKSKKQLDNTLADVRELEKDIEDYAEQQKTKKIDNETETITEEPNSEPIIEGVEGKATSTSEVENQEAVEEADALIEHNIIEIPKKKSRAKKVVDKVKEIVGLKRNNVKEIKADFISQIEVVEGLKEDKEALIAKGYEVDGKGNVTILVKDDGTFSFPINDVKEIKAMVEKEFPSNDKLSAISSTSGIKSRKVSQYYQYALNRGSLERNQIYVDNAKYNVDEANKVLEQAKKDGDTKLQKQAEKLLEIFNADLQEQEAILNYAVNIDYEIENTPNLRNIASDLLVSPRELLDLLNDYKLVVTKENAENVLLLDEVKKNYGTIDNAKVELQKGIDDIKKQAKEKYGYKNKEGQRKPKNNKEVQEQNRWVNKIQENEAKIKMLDSKSKELASIDKKVLVEDTKGKEVYKIVDVGEKIGGAKKDLANQLGNITVKDIESQPLSKSFPEPNYKLLVEEGIITKDEAIFLKYLYDNIPSKPRKAYRVASWVSKVQNAIDTFKDILGSETLRSKLINGDVEKKLGDNYAKHKEILEAFGFPENEINLGGYEITRDYIKGNYMITKGNYIIKDGFATIQDAVFALQLNNSISKGKGKNIKFNVYQDTRTKEYFIGKKGATGVVRVVEGLNRENAHKFLKDNQEKLESIWNGMKANPNERRLENRNRVGTDWRKGENISGEKFAEVFGFRGVEFGNWVNNSERQQSVNDAYDAFMDMANILGISPSAISLNGELGFAFGARGSGKHSAHYERDKVVINLTKTKGAGSLAHEWFHALDNYFARARGYKSDFITDSPRQKVNRDGTKDISVRPEVLEAFNKLVKAINASDLPKRSRKLDATRSQPYWSTTIEMGARAFENYLIEKLAENNESNDYLANFKELGEWINDSGESVDAINNFPYPLETENESINNAFQELFDVIQEKKEGDKTILFSLGKETKSKFTKLGKEIFDKFAKRLKAVFPKIKLNTFTDWKEAVGHTQLRTPNGIVYGFVKDGQVFINENELNANTLVHEYGHIFAQILKAQYPTAHKNLIDRIKQEKALIEAKRKDPNYANLTDEQLADEVLNELIGNKGETILNTKKPIHKEILDLLNRFWNRLKNIFTTGSPNIAKWSVEQFQNATIDDIVNNVTADLLSGRKLSNVSSDMLGGKSKFQIKDNTQYDYNNPLHNDLNELLNDYISITEEGETSLEDLKDTVGEDLYNTLLSELGENFILSKISPPSIETFEQGVKDAKTSKEKKDLSLVKRGDLTFGEDAKQLFDEMGRKYTPDKWKEIEPKVDEYVQKLLASPNFDEDVENIIKYISDTSTTELTESKGLATAQTMLLNKIAFHAYQMGKKELFKKVFKFSAERGKVFGQAIAAYAEASTPESLLNQAVAIFEGENDQVLNTIQPSGKTMLEELEDVLSKISITAEQVEQVLKQTEAKRKGVTQRARKPRTQPTQTTDKPVSTKQREKANDKIKDAKARLSDWFKENMNIGFAYNPKEEAEKTLQLVSILKDLAIGYLQLGTSNITYIKEQIQKSLGDKIKIDDVWSQVYDDEVSQLHKQNQKDAIINNIVSQFKDGKTSSTKDVSSIIARSLALQAKKISGKKSTQTDMAQRVKELLENKDLARQAWEEALSKAKEEINAKNIPLQEKIDLIHKIEDAVGNFIAIPQSISRKAIRKGMKDVDTTIDDLIKSHFTQKEAKMNDIVKAIVDNTGLSLQDSIEYYDILYKEFNDMLSEKQTKQLEKTLYPKKITRKQKNEVQKMVEAINMGALGTDSFIQAFGEKFGLKKLNEEQVANIKKFTDLMYATDGEIRRRLAKELSDYIDSLKPMDARNIGRLLNNIVIHHALSGITTIAQNIPLGSTLSTITNLLPVIIMNPIRTVRFLGAYNKAGLSGTGTKALADPLRSGYNDMDFFLTEDDMLKKGSRYYNFINKLGFDNPKDFLTSVLYKIPMHFAYMASAFDNIINHRGGELLNFIDEYKLASKEVGDVHTKVLERMGYDKASTYSEQVDEEIEDIKALGMKVPIGYKERRVKELMVAGRNKELQQQAYETIKTYGLMGQPDSILGFIYNHSLKKWGNIKDTDNNLMVAIKTILNITLGMFTRITVAGIEMSLKSTPIFGLMMSAYKYDSKTDKFRATTWEEKKKALAMQAMITGTLIAILAEMFDYDDDELKLNPNRRIDITGSKIPFFDRETLQGEDGFVEPLSFGYRKKDGTMKYVSFAKYIPVFVPLLAFVGNMRDKLEVRDTKQLGKEEFNTNSIKVDASLLLSLITDTFSAQNVASYNTIGNFLTDMVKARSYHNDNPDIQAEKRREKVNKVLFKTFVSRPGKTLLMPNLYKSVVQLTEYGTDATETMDGVYKNSIKEFYGLDHLVNHEQLDMFGNEVKQPFPIFGLDNEDRYELPEWKMLVDKNITFESPYIGEKATFKGEKVEVSQKDRLILNDKLSIIFGNLVRENIDELKEMNQMKLLQTLKAYANASEKQLKAMPYKEALKLDVKVQR